MHTYRSVKPPDNSDLFTSGVLPVSCKGDSSQTGSAISHELAEGNVHRGSDRSG